MTTDLVPSDVAILDLLRKQDSMTVSQLAISMDVTATAVRQRLNRLMAQGFLDRRATKAGRGRPSHRYVLTSKGRRQTGANFADLAMALWEEIRSIQEPDVRRGLLNRISHRLASMYSDSVEGNTLEQRMAMVAELFADRRIPFSVEIESELPVLTAHACPYPELAEQDRSICAMEKMLFAELVGEDLRLSKCRLDGEDCCSFEVSRPKQGS
jgi:DeoR family suf operon transcriptional repressor